MSGLNKVPAVQQQVIALFEGRFPMAITAFVLGLTVPQVQVRRKQMGLCSKKGIVRTSTYVWNMSGYPKKELDEIDPSFAPRLKTIWLSHLENESWKFARVEREPEDLSPVSAICEYRELAPTELFKRLFGLSEKAFTKIAKAVGKKLPAAKALKVNAIFYHSHDFPEMPKLSKSQTLRMRVIAEKLIKERSKFIEKQVKEHKKKLFADLQKLNKRIKGPKTPCRDGRCKTEWSRTQQFFGKTTDTPDGLNYVCKYCTYLQAVDRRNRKATKKIVRRNPSLSEAEVSELLPKFKALLAQELPSAYVRRFFNLSQRQFGRLMKSAEVSIALGVGQGRLLRFRQMQRKDFPVFAELTQEENNQLRSIWIEDQEQWKSDVRKSDEETKSVLQAEYHRIHLHEPEVVSAGSKPCQGGYGCRYWKTRFFFPVVAGRLKDYCRLCYNRTARILKQDAG